MVLFTVKICEKKFILKEKKSEYIMREKTVLTMTNHPFIIKLFYTFQDSERLCILLLSTIVVEILYMLDWLGGDGGEGFWGMGCWEEDLCRWM